MSIDNLIEQVADFRAQAKQIQGRASGFEREVDSNTSLSDEGKQEQKTRGMETFKNRLIDLREREKAAVAARKESITKGLFGVVTSDPAYVITYRDAQDRAERLADAREALATLDRAESSGDTTLAAAILLKAVESGWRSVINAYAERHPGTKESLSDLQGIASYESNGFARTIAYAY